MKTSVRTVSLFSALLIVAGIAAWMQPEAAFGIGGCRCTQTFSTAQVTGTSTVDCIWAKMDAQTQAEALVPCDSTCSETLVVIDDNNCAFWPAGQFEVVARIDYQCEICIDNPEM